jgi:transcriptional regulator with XRE-family HTH domain
MELNYRMIGKRIRRFRMSKDITQEELAFQIHTSAAYISNVERGRKKVSLQKLCEISEILGVTVNDLIYSSPGQNPVQGARELNELLSLCSVEEQKILLENISSIIQTFIS